LAPPEKKEGNKRYEAGRRQFLRDAARLPLAACAASPAGARAEQAAPDGAALRRALERVECMTEGRAGEAVHVFFDPDCPVCAILFRRTRRAVDAGQLRLKWIPVALLGPESLWRSARLLAASDRMRALSRAFGRAEARTAPSPRTLSMVPAVLGNSALLRWIAGPRPATPSLLHQAAGGRWALLAGLRQDMLPDAAAPAP
jgi:hypothetical protein